MFGLFRRCNFCKLEIPKHKVEKFVKMADGRYKKACPSCYSSMGRPTREMSPSLKWRGRHRK